MQEQAGRVDVLCRCRHHGKQTLPGTSLELSSAKVIDTKSRHPSIFAKIDVPLYWGLVAAMVEIVIASNSGSSARESVAYCAKGELMNMMRAISLDAAKDSSPDDALAGAIRTRYCCGSGSIHATTRSSGKTINSNRFPFSAGQASRSPHNLVSACPTLRLHVSSVMVPNGSHGGGNGCHQRERGTAHCKARRNLIRPGLCGPSRAMWTRW